MGAAHALFSGGYTPPPSFGPNVNALSFSAQSADFVGATPFNPSGDFTIEAWVKLAADNTTNCIIAARSDSGNHWSFNIRNDSHGLCLSNQAGGFVDGGASDTIEVANGWVHLAVTREGDLYTFYIDGVGYKSQTATRTWTTDGLKIGYQAPFGTFQMDGKIDEVRLWNVARSAGDIATYYSLSISPSSSGLVGYYRFDEGAGTTTDDETGNNDCTISDAGMWTADVPY